MKKYDLMIPEGAKDLIFDECAVKRDIEKRLRSLFEGRGYSEVITSGLEFFDVFNGKARYFPQEQLYKLVDSKNRLLVIRPDSTMPIARLVATRLKDSVFPLKVFYNQNVYLVNPKNSGNDDESSQSGIEIIGGDIEKTDIEALSLAVEAMKFCSGNNFRFEIGSSEIFNGLIDLLNISDEEIEEIRNITESKNFPMLDKKLKGFDDSEVIIALRELPSLFGGKDIFTKAENLMKWDFARNAIASLKNAYTVLESMQLGNRITVDFGIVNRKNYYTGLLFKAYVEGYGKPILSGGRYDTLIGDFGKSVPATGFGVNIDPLCILELKKEKHLNVKTPSMIVFADEDCVAEALRHCSLLIRQGIIAENSVLSSLDETIFYARKRGIQELHKVSKTGIEIIDIK